MWKYAKGQKFGKLTLHKQMGNRPSGMWLALCECGGNAVGSANDMRRGRIQSCGCMLYLGAKLSKDSVREIIQSKLSTAELAERFGVTIYVISNARSGRNWKCIEGQRNRMYERRYSRAKLTADMVAEIKQALSGCVPRGINKKLAIQYGVSDRTISAIRCGRSWSIVEVR